MKWYTIILLMLVGVTLVSARSFDTNDLDQVCMEDGKTLIRNSGLWDCGTMTATTFTNYTYNITLNITNNITSNDGWNTTSQMINATNGMLNSAGGWTNTTTTTKTSLKGIVQSAEGGWTSRSQLDVVESLGGTALAIIRNNVSYISIYSPSGTPFAAYLTTRTTIAQSWLDGTHAGTTYSLGDTIFGSNRLSPILFVDADNKAVGINVNTTNQALTVLGNSNVSNVSYQPQNVLTSGFSGQSLLGVSGALLIPNKTTTYNGVRQGGQTGASFNGSQYDFITTNNVFNWSKTNLSFSVNIWVNYSSLQSCSTCFLISKGAGGAYEWQISYSNSTKIIGAILYRKEGFNIAGCSFTTSNNLVNIVSNLMLVSNNTNLSCYTNSNLYEVQGYQTGTNSTNYTYGVADINIMARAGINPSIGSVFKVNIWNRSLSSSEVAAEYALGPNSPTTNTNGLVLQYLLNKTPDVMETYSNTTHVKDVSYISTGEYLHKRYDVSGVPIVDKMPYAMFSSINTQVAVAANTAYPINFSNTEENWQIQLLDSSNITVQQSGDYKIDISAVFQTDTANKHIEIWLQKNGVNVARSNTHLEVGLANAEQVVAVPYIIDLNSTDRIRFMWASDDAGSSILYTTNTSYSPETPSIIATMYKIGEITP